ncbi:nickel-dependent lactate racemase [bacterium 1XD21-13]|nr:nickel-dependent lactate racemase [bacterium 1XD21-13]
MNIQLPFGKEQIELSIPDHNFLKTLMPNAVEEGLMGDDEVIRSLENPIHSKRLKDLVTTGQKVVIVTSDITRPMPSYVILPHVLKELNDGGIPDSDITVVFALGSHRAHTEEEKQKLVGEAVYSRVSCIDSKGDFTHMGTTSRGTPVDIFKPVAEADIRICLGNIEFHYFAGYSGGSKAIMPGVSTRDAIQCNHSRMVQEEARAGAMAGNPIREDIDEVCERFVPIDFIVNVVLDEKKRIRRCVSGHFIEAHREGCRFLDQLYKVQIPKKADIVVVSAGGYPKDINLYQAQKALDNSKHAVRDGGCIIWVASAYEGLGEGIFEKWMTGHEKAHDMIEHISQDFQLGGHKAAAIAMVLEKAQIVLCSDLEPDFVRSIHLTPGADPQTELNAALERYGKDAAVIVMPYGGSTLPCT